MDDVKWGSARHHELYIITDPTPIRKRCMCRCGCRKKQTHLVVANGVALSSGCELQARRMLKKLRDPQPYPVQKPTDNIIDYDRKQEVRDEMP